MPFHVGPKGIVTHVTATSAGPPDFSWNDEEEIPNIAALVKAHAVAAWSLAQLERRPPGYDLWEWAAYLMDLEPEALRERLGNRVKVLSEGFVSDVAALMGSATESDLMNIPDRAPIELLPKMRELNLKWTVKLVQREATKALSGFIGTKRTPEQMHRIGVALNVAINRVRQRVGELPVETSFAMTACGEFKLTLKERTPRV